MYASEEIPPTWLKISLGDVVNYGSALKAEPIEIADDTWVLELEDIEKNSSRVLQKVRFSERQSKSTKNKFEAGDVLYGKLRPYLNKVVYADEAGVCTTEIVPIKGNQAINSKYLFYWLKHPVFINYVTEVSHGVNMPRLGTDAGKQAPLVLAPLGEQRRIADKLDTTLARVDTLNDRLARITPLLKRFRQSVLAAATSGRLTEDWRILNRMNSDLSSGWSISKLGNSALNKNNLRIPISEALRNERRGNYPYYGASGVIDRIDGYTHDGEFLLIGEDGANLLARSKPIAFRASGKIWVNNHAHVLTSDSKDRLNYLSYAINSIDLTPWVTGSAQPKLTRKALDSIPINLPPDDEQTEIVRRVETLLAFADRLEARLQSAQTAAERLTPALLAKAFRGELVPQDPNDEPAAELLRRLRAARAADTASKPKRGRAAKASTVSE